VSGVEATLLHPIIQIKSTNVAWIRNCSAYSEPMTSNALGELAAAGGCLCICSSERAGGCHGCHLECM